MDIDYSKSAEHVGINRSSDGGNTLHVLERISAHQRAMASVLHTGAAQHHRASPAETLQLERLYGCPVLLSGLPSLVLTKKELSSVMRHHRITLCRLQRLPKTTPDCVVYFLAGTLPSTALIHLRQLGLLCMLARLGDTSALQQVGRGALLHGSPYKSWFQQLRSVTEQYSLPDPLFILQSPPSKESWKKQCKSMVVSWWEQRLRGEASLLPSLSYFQPSFMSLNKPHPMWTMADNPHEVSKATTVATMLSGRYVTDHRARYWSSSNPQGFCQLCLITGQPRTLGTLEHMLLRCPVLADIRSRSMSR